MPSQPAGLPCHMVLDGVPAYVMAYKGALQWLVPRAAREGGACCSAVDSASPATAADVVFRGRCSACLGDWLAQVPAEGRGQWVMVSHASQSSLCLSDQESGGQSPEAWRRSHDWATGPWGEGHCPHRDFLGLAGSFWVWQRESKLFGSCWLPWFMELDSAPAYTGPHLDGGSRTAAEGRSAELRASVSPQRPRL